MTGAVLTRVALTLACAFLAVSVADQPKARAGVTAADAKTEVSASVYYMASVVEALSKEFDAKIQAKSKRIQALSAQLRTTQSASVAEVAKLRGELTGLQDEVVAQLAARDEQLARQVTAFRHDVQSISATPEGLEALRLFNAGQWKAADAIFQRIIAAVDRAEALASALRRAAPRRQRARLAFEARERGQATTKEVTALFEDVTRLDPGNVEDWDSLAHLYDDDGRSDDAISAAKRMLDVSPADEKVIRGMIFADIISDREPARAEELFRIVLQAKREVAKTNKDAEWVVGMILDRVAAMQKAQGKFLAAEKTLEEALPILRQGGKVDPEVRARRLARALQDLSGLFTREGKADKVEAPALEAVSIWRRLEKQHPDQIVGQNTLANLYLLLSGGAFAQGQLEKALGYQKDAVAIDRKLVAQDASYRNKSSLANKLYLLGEFSYRGGKRAEAESALTESSDLARALGKERPTVEATESLAAPLLLLSKVILERDDPEKASVLAQEAVLLHRQLISSHPDRQDLAKALAIWGAALDRVSEFATARLALEEALGLLPGGGNSDLEVESDILNAYQSVLYGLGKAGDGIDVFEKSLKDVRHRAEVAPNDIRLRVYVLVGEWRVGLTRLARRELGPARASFDRVSALVGEPADDRLSFMKAYITVARGDLERLENRSSAALADYEQAVRLFVQDKGASPKDPGDLFNLLEPKFRIAQLKADQAGLADIVATYRKFGGRKGVHRWAANWIDDLDAVAKQKH